VTKKVVGVFVFRAPLHLPEKTIQVAQVGSQQIKNSFQDSQITGFIAD
jgi:hypothetical protein